MSHSYKVGDLVRCRLSATRRLIGMTGTVVKVDSGVSVNFSLPGEHCHRFGPSKLDHIEPWSPFQQSVRDYISSELNNDEPAGI